MSELELLLNKCLGSMETDLYRNKVRNLIDDIENVVITTKEDIKDTELENSEQMLSIFARINTATGIGYQMLASDNINVQDIQSLENTLTSLSVELVIALTM